jgi:hypothetical protein
VRRQHVANRDYCGDLGEIPCCRPVSRLRFEIIFPTINMRAEHEIVINSLLSTSLFDNLYIHKKTGMNLLAWFLLFENHMQGKLGLIGIEFSY